MHNRIILIGFSYCLSGTVVRLGGVSALGSSGECTDLHDRTIAPGLHYVPGPDSCTLCVCEDGNPKWCKAVLCSPPQDCKSFRVGNSCCDFICLDDKLPKHDLGGHDISTDLTLRLLASSVTAVLCLSLLFFLVHRLRQRKIRGRQNRQMSDDERSIGYLAGSLAYLPDGMGYGNQDRHPYDEPPTHCLWKPPGNYFPRGEAPPPYEEAVAAARAEAALAAALAASASNHGHRTIPINLFRLEPIETEVPRAASAAIRSDAFYEDVLLDPVSPPCEFPLPPPPPVFTVSSERLNDLSKSEDADDYRSECENCKSAHGSSYYVDRNEGPAGGQEETMTLHRRPDYDVGEEASYYRASLTLPVNSRRNRCLPLHGTAASSLHGARENWFSSMPASSTSSSDEE